IFLNGMDISRLFCQRVGIIKTEVRITSVLFSQSKVQANRLSVADMQIAVGLRGKAGYKLLVFTGLQVFFYYFFYKIQMLFFLHGFLIVFWQSKGKTKNKMKYKALHITFNKPGEADLLTGLLERFH